MYRPAFAANNVGYFTAPYAERANLGTPNFLTHGCEFGAGASHAALNKSLAILMEVIPAKN